MKGQSADERRQRALAKRLELVERGLENLAKLVANHVADPPTLLVGWNEISAYCRKRPRTLSRYAKGLAFPAFRWAGHVVSSPHIIDSWLITRERARREQKGWPGEDPVPLLSDDDLRGRIEELDRKLKR